MGGITMAKFSTALLNKLTEFLVCEIESDALGGKTYTLITKEDKDKEKYRNYMEIKKEALECGYSNDQVFRVYELSNGYIFDMDLSVAKKITIELSKSVSKANNGETPVGDLIGNRPEERRRSDMIRLGNYIKKCAEQGQYVTEVALFSKNSVPKIVITGKGPKGESLVLRYQSYAIRHWDIEAVNTNILIPSGIRISRLEPAEILPSKTGVRFIIHIEKI